MALLFSLRLRNLRSPLQDLSRAGILYHTVLRMDSDREQSLLSCSFLLQKIPGNDRSCFEEMNNEPFCLSCSC